MEKHFVTFCSPGTFVSEETTKEIESWNVQEAEKMSIDIVERNSALPYGFYFTTRSRDSNELDSKQTSKSGMYYFGGDVLTLDEVKSKNDPHDRILISNMESNKFDKIIINTNSWKFTVPFHENDVVLTN